MIKIKVHPLFFLFGLYYAFTKRIFIFLIYTISCLIHEIGHSIIASEKGYKLNKITLMPFGAVVSGNIEGLKHKDEIAIALAGPIINFLVAVIFVAGWWIYPEIYPYTDMAVYVNLSLGLLNLFPAYPLDGGRILSSFLALKINSKKAEKIAKTVGIIFSALFFSLFVYSIFNGINPSLLFFGLFILFGALEKKITTNILKSQ